MCSRNWTVTCGDLSHKILSDRVSVNALTPPTSAHLLWGSSSLFALFFTKKLIDLKQLFHLQLVKSTLAA